MPYKMIVLALMACLALQHGAEAGCQNRGRHLLAVAAEKPVRVPNPKQGATNLQIEVAFNEQRNKVTATTVQGIYGHLIHNLEHTTPCTSQVTTAADPKAAIEPRPEPRNTWIPENFHTVQIDLKSQKTCSAPVLSTSDTDFYHSRLDVGAMNGDGSELEYDRGSCVVALSMFYKEGGCACHCFEGRATVTFQDTFSRVMGSNTREIVTCTSLEREPQLGCRCSLCGPAAA